MPWTDSSVALAVAAAREAAELQLSRAEQAAFLRGALWAFHVLESPVISLPLAGGSSGETGNRSGGAGDAGASPWDGNPWDNLGGSTSETTDSGGRAGVWIGTEPEGSLIGAGSQDASPLATGQGLSYWHINSEHGREVAERQVMATEDDYSMHCETLYRRLTNLRLDQEDGSGARWF